MFSCTESKSYRQTVGLPGRVISPIARPLPTKDSINRINAFIYGLKVFEMKMLRKICGPIIENGKSRIIYNRELCQLCVEPDIIRVVEAGRLR
jgi:hypothetical protein